MKLFSNYFYELNENEIFRFINQESETIHLVNENSSFQNNKLLENTLYLKPENLNSYFKNNLIKSKFELVVITDLIEYVENIYELLQFSQTILKENGRILITSVNPKWYLIFKIFEFIKLKKNSELRSYIFPKKIIGTFEGSGLEIINMYSKQIFPFKLFGIGSFLNKFLEMVFCPLGLGIKSYYICKPKKIIEKQYSKSIIVPAKNEEKNLPILFNELELLNLEVEIVLIHGFSSDNTEKVSLELYEKYKNHKNIKLNVLKQTGNGKAQAVFEALNETTNDVIAIIDSDISVEPFELNNFFRTIDMGYADFVNGTRLISRLESGSMRWLNIVGNRFFQFIINYIISQNISDSLCGTKVFKRENLNHLKKWQEKTKRKDPFGDFDLLLSSAYAGLKIVEYPIYYRRRVYGETQISRFKDGYKLIKYILKALFLFKTSYYTKIN